MRHGNFSGSGIISEFVGRQGRNSDVEDLPRTIMDLEFCELLVHSIRTRGEGVRHLQQRCRTSQGFAYT